MGLVIFYSNEEYKEFTGATQRQADEGRHRKFAFRVQETFLKELIGNDRLQILNSYLLDKLNNAENPLPVDPEDEAEILRQKILLFLILRTERAMIQKGDNIQSSAGNVTRKTEATEKSDGQLVYWNIKDLEKMILSKEKDIIKELEIDRKGKTSSTSNVVTLKKNNYLNTFFEPKNYY